ncbi:SDR family NAD(P)-dependent oxidoreductase [Spirillospora sp. CA-294931]|uniref:SDR family NAD(P)-dependent oxidoreductase n=1 Tax=Spirillospora sp. CA-294931 TaxID=3240042 RepID=UPI003D910B8A
MRDLNGKVAVVTGAASGIGAATARELARRGCDLALSDLNEDGLKKTAVAAERLGAKVSVHVVDAGDREAIYAFADAVTAEHGRAHILVNNAGVALIADAAAMSEPNLEWIMDINFWGVVHGTRAFLPHLERSGGGHIVNVSSVFGLFGVPSQSAYCASKFAVRGFTESLRMELDLAGSPVSVTSVHPGGIRTNIVASARYEGTAAVRGGTKEGTAALFEKIARTTPERAATVIVAAITANRRRVRIGADAVALDLLARTFPRGYQRALVAAARTADRLAALAPAARPRPRKA